MRVRQLLYILRVHVPQEEAVFTVSSLLLHISEKDEQILSSLGSSQKAQGKDNWEGQSVGGSSLEPRAYHSTDDSLQNSRDPSYFFCQFRRFRP